MRKYVVDVLAGVIIEIPPAPAAGLIEMEVVAVVLSDLLFVLLLLLVLVSVVSVLVLVSVESVSVVFASFPVLVSEVLSEAVVEWAVSVAVVSVVLSRVGQLVHGR